MTRGQKYIYFGQYYWLFGFGDIKYAFRKHVKKIRSDIWAKICARITAIQRERRETNKNQFFSEAIIHSELYYFSIGSSTLQRTTLSHTSTLTMTLHHFIKHSKWQNIVRS